MFRSKAPLRLYITYSPTEECIALVGAASSGEAVRKLQRDDPMWNALSPEDIELVGDLPSWVGDLVIFERDLANEPAEAKDAA